MHGLPTYITEPPNGAAPKGIIVIIPDAFGLPFINNQILADNYASKGQFRVYLPDFMDGQPAPTWMMQTFSNVFATKALWNWIRKPYDIGCAMYGFLPFVIRNTFGKSMPKVTAFITAVRKEEGATLPIGAAGFCWRGPHAVNLGYGAEAVGPGSRLWM